MGIETEGLSPEDRARRYRAKAEEARRLLADCTDPMMRETLQKLANDWEFLADYSLKKRP